MSTSESTKPSKSRVVTLVAHRVAKVGGMERAFAELAEGLLARGYEVNVISRYVELAPHPKLRVVELASPNRPFLFAYPLFLVRGSIATRRHRRGLVHVLGAIVLNSADVATVQFCHHGFDPAAAQTRSRKNSLLYRLSSRGAHQLSVVTERLIYGRPRVRWLIPAANGVARELQSHFPTFSDKMTVIPNGVDRAAFKPTPDGASDTRIAIGLTDGDLLAAFVGGDWERKGLRFAIEALEASPAWQLVVVGEGPVERYVTLARQRQVESRVHFVGHQADTSPYFAAADAFLLPTAYEAFPLVMLEAAASGLPVLVTRVNGAEDFVEDGVNGFFIERDAADIATRLGRLADMRDSERRALGVAARDATARYSWDHIVESHIAVYERLSAGS
jgi:glycosyltransferase involved in cell wall biosynthesis